jgi:hypothetical protein
MHLNPEFSQSNRLPSVPMGRFSISPTSQLTDTGAYRACVTVSSGRGIASHHRIYRLERHHATPQAALLVALTQGWLQTCDPSPAMC